MRHLFPLACFAALAPLAFACSAEPASDGGDAIEDVDSEVVARKAEPRNYADAPGWSSTCEGPSLTQSDLATMLGDRRSKVLGRFDIAYRSVCMNPGCDDRAYQAEPERRQERYAFGIAPHRNPRYASWRFFGLPLFVHDTGSVLARKVGDHIVVQLVGDIASTEIGTAMEMDGTVSGRQKIRGRLLSGDLVRAGNTSTVLSWLELLVNESGKRIDAASVDPDRVLRTDPLEPLMDGASFESVYGNQRWGDSVSRSLNGLITPTCLRLTDGMKTPRYVVTATFGATN